MSVVRYSNCFFLRIQTINDYRQFCTLYKKTKLINVIRSKSLHHKIKILAYNLNERVVELIVEASKEVIPQYLSEINGSYSQIYSLRDGYVRSIFEKQYKHIRIQNKEDLIQLINGIHQQHTNNNLYEAINNPNSYYEYQNQFKSGLINKGIKNHILCLLKENTQGDSKFRYISDEALKNANLTKNLVREVAETFNKYTDILDSEYKLT